MKLFLIHQCHAHNLRFHYWHLWPIFILPESISFQTYFPVDFQSLWPKVFMMCLGSSPAGHSRNKATTTSSTKSEPFFVIFRPIAFHALEFYQPKRFNTDDMDANFIFFSPNRDKTIMILAMAFAFAFAFSFPMLFIEFIEFSQMTA